MAGRVEPERSATRRTPIGLSTYRARRLRRDETDAEAFLWSELRDRRCNGWKFRRQVPIKGYVADFVCSNVRLIVELDGSQHAYSAYDRARDAKLAEAGYHVLRFWNHEVLRDRHWALDRIVAALEGRE